MEKKMEIFAVGKWNGMTFSLRDLEQIIFAFTTLGDNHRVPLKLGHTGKPEMKGGQPALGWAKGLAIEGDKLIATCTDVPEAVMTAIDKKLYRNVSVELNFNVKYKEQAFPIVLSGIALLGADIPAVNTLKDLTHYTGQSAGFSIGRQMVFSAIAGINKGEHNMELDELIKQVAALSKSVTEVQTANAALTAENTTLKAEKATFTASAAAAKAVADKTLTDTKRADINAVFEEGIKAELITPAQRGQFTKLLKLDDDVAVAGVSVDDVKALVTGGKKFDFGRKETGKGGNIDDTRTPDVKLAAACQECVDKKEATDLFSAQAIVFRRDPDLAKEYFAFNGSK
jgi:regulator of replication initiation timing